MKQKSLLLRIPYRFKSIKAQLRIAFAILIITMIVCIAVAMTVLGYVSTAQNHTIAEKSMAMIEKSLESRIDALRKLIPIVRRDSIIQNALHGNGDMETVARQMSKLYVFGLQHRYVITMDKQVLDPVYGSRREQTDNMLRLAGFEEFLKSGREEMFSAPHRFPFSSLEGDRISYFFRLRDTQSNYESQGYALFIVSIASLIEDDRSLIQSQFDDFYIVDHNNMLIYNFRQDKANQETLEHVTRRLRLNNSGKSIIYGDNLYFSSPVQSYPSWYMVGVISSRNFSKSATLVIGIVSIFAMFGISLIMWISKRITNGISTPVEKLSAAMTEFESGRSPHELHIEGASGEMVTLVRGFNHMLVNIQHYLDRILEEENEKKTAEVVALQYQLQSLQNQINPHFLYNTLNIISFLALDGQVEAIRGFNQSLIALLRATLSDTRDTVRIEVEISYLKAYMDIMAYRYPDMFTVHITMDDNIADCEIPKLILQPLVENAMLHGIAPSGKSGLIEILIEEEEDSIRVSVGDDGVGMDQQKLKALLLPRKGFTGIGLQNVNDRLILCYGQVSALVVSSEQNMGTLVVFRLPKNTPYQAE